MAKLIITADQMMRLLAKHPPKFPITINLKGLSKAEQEMLFRKIKDARAR